MTSRPLSSFTVPEFDGNPYRITSLSYSPDGQDVLVSYSSDHLYLFSVKVIFPVKLFQFLRLICENFRYNKKIKIKTNFRITGSQIFKTDCVDD